MLFNSAEFGVFFVFVFFVTWALYGKLWMRNLFLCIVSVFFYMCWNPRFIVLILAATIIDYAAASFIHRSTVRKVRVGWLLVSLISNLGILFAFKYLGFATSTLQMLVEWLGLPVTVPQMSLLLPVGISFYTFQSMSYTLDIYYGTLKPCRNFMDFLTFVAFFPQLVAGPIVRASDFVPQLYQNQRLTQSEAGWALFRVMQGLVKKVVISDFLSINLVDRVFETPYMYSSLEVLVAAYGYSLQIYCDFSGYSDIAVGTAKLLGFWLPENFDLPYKAQSIREFWRRWHISLSTWLKDYLYIPLGGNRGKWAWLTYRNLFLTMLLGGLWHGAAWTFVLWGALHGGALALNHWWVQRKGSPSKTPERTPGWRGVLLTLATFHFVCFCFVLFRAGSFQVFLDFMEAMFQGTFDTSNLQPLVMLALLAGFLGHMLPKRWFDISAEWYGKLPSLAQAAVIGLVVWGVWEVAGSGVVPFIYFQF